MEKNNNYTYGMIKPDGMRHAKEILKMIYEQGLEIIYYECGYLTAGQIDKNYVHCAKYDDYDKMKEYLLSKPVLKMIITDKEGNAIKKYRNLVENIIRKKYGNKSLVWMNAVHASKNEEEVKNEIMEFLGNNILKVFDQTRNYFLLEHALTNAGNNEVFQKEMIIPRYIDMIEQEIENKMDGESK